MKRGICDTDINNLKEELEGTLTRGENKFPNKIYAEEVSFREPPFANPVGFWAQNIPLKGLGESLSSILQSGVSQDSSYAEISNI